ncbi:hypothetical protein K458DRAFT_385731 [Lentithecium fluviatile CBS 122367]|uniref:Uncharacterized protein n=1 Tax=Lentithecium fluviatile CBS 122367 TaxID=1168545 RepID=A0A6G1JD64_9PLEO|nr:hypothetical protein K458DRAFT_385731 [Lentithecium fluviatile CBS 122367]
MNYVYTLGCTRTARRNLQVWNDPGFEKALVELTSIGSNYVYFEYDFQVQRSQIKELERMDQMYLKTGALRNQDLPGTVFEKKIRFMEAWVTDIHNKSTYLAKRAEVQVQICHSLMAQRDNHFNMEVSAFDKLDSNDMRTIAVATLFFLPATFMATLFCASFFNFQGYSLTIS